MVKRTRKHRGGETAEEKWMREATAKEDKRVEDARALNIPKYVPPPTPPPIRDTLFKANYGGRRRRSRRRRPTKRRAKVC